MEVSQTVPRPGRKQTRADPRSSPPRPLPPCLAPPQHSTRAATCSSSDQQRMRPKRLRRVGQLWGCGCCRRRVLALGRLPCPAVGLTRSDASLIDRPPFVLLPLGPAETQLSDGGEVGRLRAQADAIERAPSWQANLALTSSTDSQSQRPSHIPTTCTMSYNNSDPYSTNNGGYQQPGGGQNEAPLPPGW